MTPASSPDKTVLLVGGDPAHLTLPNPEAPATAGEAGISLPGPLPQPGEQVRWRHPRLAFARGRFAAYGPGPFEVVAVVRGGQAAPLALVVKTEFGEREIDAAWLGLSLPARRRVLGEHAVPAGPSP